MVRNHVNNWKGYKMKFGKFIFKSFKQFQHIQNLAIDKGVETMEEFNKFLNSNYSELLIKG